VDGDITVDMDLAGFAVDLDLADMTSVRKMHVGSTVVAGGIKGVRYVVRPRRECADLRSQIEQGDRAVGARDAKFAVLELNVSCRCFENMRGCPASLLDDDVAGIGES